MHSDLREHDCHQENGRAAAPRRRPAAALLSVCLGFFVIQLDVTIVNVALRVPLLVAAAGYLIAIAVACLTLRRTSAATSG